MKLVALCLIAFLLTTAGCASLNKPSRSSARPWACEAQLHLKSVEQAFESYRTIADPCPPMLADDETVLRWVHDLRPGDVVNLVRRSRCEAILVYELNELWCVTSYCGFGEVKVENLVAQVPEILKRYRAFLEANEGRDIGDVVMQNIGRNLELLDSPYCLAAMRVLARSIWFRAAPETWPVQGVRLPEPACRAIASQMRDWYHRFGPSLVWNPQASALCLPGEMPVGFPEDVARELTSALARSPRPDAGVTSRN